MRRISGRAAGLAVVIACLLAGFPLDGSAQPVDEPSVVAEHAIVVDVTTGDILLDKGANEPVAIASLTKLFTAFAAIETTPLGTAMTVNDSDIVGEASMGITAGEVLSFETLLHGMLLPSGNDAAHAIARNLGARAGDTDQQATQRFIDRVNTRLTTLGLTGTHFVNPHGLDEDGHYSTARDIAALTIYALDHEPTFADVLGAAEFQGDGHLIYNTNRLLGDYEGLLGGKTGVTDNAGYCLMQVAERDGRRVVIVLLGSTADEWYADAEALLDYGFAATAIPASATRYGQISFGTSAVAVEPQSAEAIGLDVVETAGAAIVAQPAIAAAPRHSPWFWIAAATLLAPASLLALAQLRRLLARQPVRSRPRHVVRLRRTAAPTYAPDPYTPASSPLWLDHLEPSVAFGPSAADYRFDRTAEWHVPDTWPAPRRRYGWQLRPVYVASYGGD